MPRSPPTARSSTPRSEPGSAALTGMVATRDLAHQAQQPPINPDEMANTPTNGIYPPLIGGYSALLAQKLQSRPYTPLIQQIFGADVFTTYTPQQIFETLWAEAIAAFQGVGRDLSVQLEVRRLHSMACRRRLSTRSPHPRSAGGFCTGSDRIRPTTRPSAVPNASSATPPRHLTRYSRLDHAGGKEFVHDVLLCQHRRPRRIPTIPTIK